MSVGYPDFLRSSQSFVRSLKSSTDPPSENGPSKIVIARQAWDSQSLYVPRKAELLLEWIITRFNKEKIKKSPENPLIDPFHWLLLADVVCCQENIQVVPLIIRVSIPSIVSSFLELYPLTSDTSKSLLLPSVLRALNVIWPIVAQRAGIDSLSECLWTSVSVLDQIYDDEVWYDVVDVFALVFTAFGAAFDNASAAGRKKVYLALTQNQLHPWLRAIHLFPPSHPMHEQLYSLGVKILLCPDALRISLDVNTRNPISNASTEIISIVFGSSIKSSDDVLKNFLRLLPRLTQSYFGKLRKYRNASFTGQANLAKRIRDATGRFQNCCLEFLKDLVGVPSMVLSIWAARAEVLAVIEKENVFDCLEDETLRENVRELGEEAIKVLDQAWDDSNSPLVRHALDILACLHRMEPDLLTLFIPKLLERLATCSITVSDTSITFLSQFISYHSKTRTLQSFISLLLASANSHFSFLPASAAQSTYRTLLCSPLVSPSFTDKLINALRAFTTPGQIDSIMGVVYSALESSMSVETSVEESPRKRRRMDIIHEDVQDMSTSSSLKFAIVARLSAVTLIAVLKPAMKSEVSTQSDSYLSRIDYLISGALEAFIKACGFEGAKLSKKGKLTHRKRDRNLNMKWDHECFLASLLGLWYDLFERSDSPGISFKGENSWKSLGILDSLQNLFANCLRDGDSDPELQFQIGRVLFASGGLTPQENIEKEKEWSALEIILHYIESSLFGNDFTSMVNSNVETPAILTRQQGALALWAMTLERHLSTVDKYCSQAQLERIIELIIRSRSTDDVYLLSVVSRAMASARFWEFANIRTSFLSVLDKQTSKLAYTDLRSWLSALVQEDSEAIDSRLKSENLNGFEPSTKVYRLLRYFPPEYLPRVARLELAKRAFAGDVQVYILGGMGKCHEPTSAEWRAVYRSFVLMVTTQTQSRVLEEVAPVESWIPYLIREEEASASHNEIFTNSTLSLLTSFYKWGLRAASSEGKEDPLESILSFFLNSNPFQDSSTTESLAQQALLRFIRVLVGDFKVSSFSAKIHAASRNLCKELEESLMPVINDTVRETSTSKFLSSGRIIEAWHVLSLFRQWLSIDTEKDRFGRLILRKVAYSLRASGSEVTDEFYANALSMIIHQVKMLPENDCSHVDILVASYILFAKSRLTNGFTTFPVGCDELISQASRSLSVAQFGAFLDVIAEGMESQLVEWSQSEIGSLLHLSKLLLREAPERTSKLKRGHVARCLRVFVNRPEFIGNSSSTTEQVLDFIHLMCTERAASLKVSDVACIWSILSRTLAGCEEHDERTSYSTFHTLVSIVNSLLRSRRDLVHLHLSQFSMILRQLFSVICGVRPLLGTKQHHLVSDKFPRWINPKIPLGGNEAHALARVLTDLTAKSLVRGHSPNDTTKAESLTRPFSRHAAYVLLAYIDIANDPLSVQSMIIRRELEPGLFALCSIMGEHGRDTLMVQSLDAGGKALLKSLWKEYNKQKYTGGG